MLGMGPACNICNLSDLASLQLQPHPHLKRGQPDPDRPISARCEERHVDAGGATVCGGLPGATRGIPAVDAAAGGALQGAGRGLRPALHGPSSCSRPPAQPPEPSC